MNLFEVIISFFPTLRNEIERKLMEDRVWNKIDSKTLVNGAEWCDAQSTVRAMVFGKMVELAKDRIKFYQSDLYHDAIWLLNTLTGPLQFDWIARESGTFIGDVTLHVKDDEWAKSARYRFDIRLEGDRKWVLDIYEAGPIVPPTDVDYSENEAYQIQSEKDERDLGAKYRDKMQEEFVLPDEFHPYFSNEPLPESVEEAVAKQDADPIKAMIDSLFARPGNPPTKVESIFDFPTLRNESTMQQNAATRKENNMDQIIRDLRDKYEEASNSKDQLEEYQSNISDAVDELDTYMSDLDDLISSLDQLPEISVYVDLDTVSFDS
jgi:hypothetical protein